LNAQEKAGDLINDFSATKFIKGHKLFGQYFFAHQMSGEMTGTTIPFQKRQRLK
jgi:hypothetical protein